MIHNLIRFCIIESCTNKFSFSTSSFTWKKFCFSVCVQNMLDCNFSAPKSTSTKTTIKHFNLACVFFFSTISFNLSFTCKHYRYWNDYSIYPIISFYNAHGIRRFWLIAALFNDGMHGSRKVKLNSSCFVARVLSFYEINYFFKLSSSCVHQCF